LGILAGQAEVSLNPKRMGLELPLYITKREILQPRPHDASRGRAPVVRIYGEIRLHKAVWLAKRERPEHERVDRAEDRRVRADANREREDRNNGEPRPAHETARSVAKVLHEILVSLTHRHRSLPLVGGAME